MKATHKRIASLLMTFILSFGFIAGLTSIKSSALDFKPRLTAPDKNNRYYFKDNPFYQAGIGMPNCTAYAYGRAFELLGTQPKLPKGNAGSWWWDNKESNTYPYGSTPKLGAIACWDDYDKNNGHVAVVEEINGSRVTISESYYNRVFFQTLTMNADSSDYSSYRFLGYIYIGDFTPVSSDKKAPTVSDIVVSRVSKEGYKITFRVSDESEIKSVQYAVWTGKNGGSSAKKHNVSLKNNAASFYVKASDYNNATSGYRTSIYATDAYGNQSVTSAPTVNLTDEPIEIYSIEYNGCLYKVYNSGLSWTEAEKWCENNGGTLATARTADEWEIIKNLLAKYYYTPCWLGAESKSGKWKWVTGEALSFTNWRKGEPNNSNGNEFYMGTYGGLYDAKGWNDFNEDNANIGGFVFKSLKTSGICGDVNGDGSVNAADRMTLTRFLAHWNGVAIISSVADLNLDGEITAGDRMVLTRHLANWQGYEKLPLE